MHDIGGPIGFELVAAFRMLMRLQGVEDSSAILRAEIDANVDLLRTGDGGTAFLKIMRGFERTPEKRALYTRVLRSAECPARIVWGAHDPALPLSVHGEAVRRAAGVDQVHTIPAKHFLEEDRAPAIARHFAELAAG